MQMVQKPDCENLLVITVGLRRWQRAGLLAKFVRLHKAVESVH